MDSGYDDQAAIVARIKRGQHREVIGGLWDELGKLQLDFLIEQGLRPEHSLLDIGCGALRGGVKLIPWLEPGGYWGIDRNAALLDVGYAIELGRLGLTARQPRMQLVQLEDFEFESLNAKFDMAIAQSVFTHLSLDRIRRCLTQLAPSMTPAASFFATFFELGDQAKRHEPQVHQPGGMTSYGNRSFYHYRLKDFAKAIEGLPWSLDYLGEWGHPRGQRMLRFNRLG
jgi:hypothetical protein